MITDRYTKVLLSVLTIALILNVLDRWITPSYAVAAENTSLDGSNSHNNCLSVDKNSMKIMKGVNNMERLLGYIESSVNDIQLTISGIDRKLSKSRPNSSWSKGELIVKKE